MKQVIDVPLKIFFLKFSTFCHTLHVPKPSLYLLIIDYGSLFKNQFWHKIWANTFLVDLTECEYQLGFQYWGLSKVKYSKYSLGWNMRVVWGTPPEPRARKGVTIMLRTINLPHFWCLPKLMRLLSPYFLGWSQFWGYTKAEIASIFVINSHIISLILILNLVCLFDITLKEDPIKI